MAIYRYEYQDPIDANVQWRWDIVPSDHSYGASTPVIALGEDCVRKDATAFKWEYDTDTFTLGIHKPLQGVVTFRWDRMPTALQTALCVTRSTSNLNIADTGLAFLTFERGASIRVWYTDDAGVTYNLVWCGMQDLDSKVVPDLESGDMVVTFMDLYQATMKTLSWATFRESLWNEWEDGASTIERRGVVDWVWKNSGGDWMYVVHVTTADVGKAGNTYMFATISDLEARYTSACTKVAGELARMAFVCNVSLSGLYTGTYKQTYDTTPTPGSALGASTAYVPVFALRDNNPASGDWGEDYCFTDELHESHPSPWDWWVDITKQSYAQFGLRYFMQGGVTPTVTAFGYAPMGNLLNKFHTDTPIDVEQYVREFKVQLFDRRLRIAKTSTEFGIDDDYESAQATAQASRNDATSTMPILYTTAPVATPTYKLATASGTLNPTVDSPHKHIKRLLNADWGDVADDGRVDWSTKVRMFGIYYYENPSSGTNAFDEAQMIRAHSWVALLNDGETATVPTTSPVTLSDAGGSIGAYGVALATQQQEGILRLLADKILATFSDTNSATITFEIDWNILKTVNGGVDIFLAWYANAVNVGLDLTAYVGSNTLFDGAPTVWYVTKCEFKIDSGRLAVECWGKP